MSRRRRIGIACTGGGTHTAFTGGVSPYHVPSIGAEGVRYSLDLDLPALRELARRPGAPILYLGTVEVPSGRFEVVSGELPVECLLASAAPRLSLDGELDHRSKLDRRPELLGELRDDGRTKVRWLLHERRSRSSLPPMLDQPQPSL